MTMTVSRLHKMLGALIEAGHGRKPVLVDRATFSDPRDNDGLLMLPPWDVQGPRWIATADDDGGTKWNKDGTEAGQQCVLIVGDCAEPEGKAGVQEPPAPCPNLGRCTYPNCGHFLDVTSADGLGAPIPPGVCSAPQCDCGPDWCRQRAPATFHRRQPHFPGCAVHAGPAGRYACTCGVKGMETAPAEWARKDMRFLIEFLRDQTHFDATLIEQMLAFAQRAAASGVQEVSAPTLTDAQIDVLWEHYGGIGMGLQARQFARAVLNAAGVDVPGEGIDERHN